MSRFKAPDSGRRASGTASGLAPGLAVCLALSCLVVLVAACTTDGLPLDGGRKGTAQTAASVSPTRSPSPPAPAGSAAGNVGDIPGATPAPTRTPGQGGSGGPGGSPSPSPTATSRVASIVVDPVELTFSGFGAPTSARISAAVTLADGSPGGYEWINLTGGAVSIDSTGLLTVSPDATAGVYTVMARAIDDPRQEFPLYVRIHGLAFLDVRVD